MAGGSSVLEDDSTLSKLDQRLHKIEMVLALVSGFAVFATMVFAVVSVSGRNAINMPVPGYVDWIEQLMPLIAFMGIAYTQRDGTHIRMDILIGRLSGRALWAAEFITTLAALILMILLVWGSWEHFQRSFDFGRPWWSNDSSIDIALPIWPAKLLVPVAFSTLCLRFALQLWGYGRAFIFGLSDPVAVPMIKSAAQQAAEEAAMLDSDT
ncbi:TRAP-type mannitol/chloroaromatic compound transport system, small permease component [Shimia gijangensis]|uniref:TRAP transporter small permease protein n=1 Tax=Shimia gijangensis TaxID=1470563 RepID=A0A1M6R9P1_9RHOB|nr:TRAP transporter small permease [Shimia gijangensis]SHK29027.1 TRAP-type mannitol/chloroaromatic compound transport system, small permease component [Shimia gijangensis]